MTPRITHRDCVKILNLVLFKENSMILQGNNPIKNPQPNPPKKIDTQAPGKKEPGKK